MSNHVGIALAVELAGLHGTIISVEAYTGGATPRFNVVGLPDTAISEAKYRIKSACAMIGRSIDDRGVTINLSPGWVLKTGTGFDLAILTAILISRDRLSADLERYVMIGEVGLDGHVLPCRGALPSVAAAVAAGYEHVVVPASLAHEAELAGATYVHGVEHIVQVLARLDPTDGPLPEFKPRATHAHTGPVSPALKGAARDVSNLCFSEVAGQENAKLAAEVAAAGRHHMLMVGSPGSGKSMIAERLPSILPPVDDSLAPMVTAMASLTRPGEVTELVRTPPFVAPHHSSSKASLIGGGSASNIVPGALSLAHGGVLFLDEAPEFSPRVLQALREPLEHRTVVISRAQKTLEFPADVQLVMAANPCPCGKALEKSGACTCSSVSLRNYLTRIGGPLLDRLDISVITAPVSRAQLADTSPSEPSSAIAARVGLARMAARERWSGLGLEWECNARAEGSVLRHELALAVNVRAGLDAAMDRGQLSARGYDRILRLAWTLADLDGASMPNSTHIGGALSLRRSLSAAVAA